MKLAMYKGPAPNLSFQLAHWLICLLTWSKYSHVELVINGVCCSSSFIDGGVRAKFIDNLETSGHWDVFECLPGDEAECIKRFELDRGKPYDWPGMLRVCPLFRWLPRRDGARFCSEAVAYFLGVRDPETYSPEDVLEAFGDTL